MLFHEPGVQKVKNLIRIQIRQRSTFGEGQGGQIRENGQIITKCLMIDQKPGPRNATEGPDSVMVREVKGQIRGNGPIFLNIFMHQ